MLMRLIDYLKFKAYVRRMRRNFRRNLGIVDDAEIIAFIYEMSPARWPEPVRRHLSRLPG
jgi:hypothetical protein